MREKEKEQVTAENAAVGGERRLKIAIYALILLAGLVFVFWFSHRAFRNTTLDLAEQYIRIQAGGTADNIETAIRSGKELDNYYGINTTLAQIRELKEDAIGVVLTDPAGEVMAAVFPETEDTELPRNMLRAVVGYDTRMQSIWENEAPEDAADGLFSHGSFDGQFFIIHGRSEEIAGRLFLVYDREHLTEEDSDNSVYVLPVVIFFAVVAGLILLILVMNVKGKALPVALVMAGLFVLMIMLFFRFRGEYEALIKESASKTEHFLLQTANDLTEKGLPKTELYRLSDYFAETGAQNDAVEEVSVSADGELSVRVNNAYINDQLRLQALNFGAIFIVCLMLCYELTGIVPVLLSKRRMKAKAEPQDGANVLATRPLIRLYSFLLYTAIYTSMPYAAMIMRQGQMQVFGLSVSVSASLPLTVELIFVLLTTILIRHIYAKERLRFLFILSLLAVVCGNFACFRVRDALFLVLLRAFCGIGFALLKYFMNALVAASSSNPSELREHFANLNAGLLGGITAGSSLGSILAGAFGYYGNYLVTAALVGLLLVSGLFIITWPVMEARREQQTTDVREISLASVFGNRQLRNALLLTDIPLNVGLMYVVAFLPVYMSVIGQAAVASSYAYLINGLAGVYIGVWMLRALRNLNPSRSVVFAIFLGAGGILLLLLGRNAFIVIASAGIMGLFDGYGTPSMTSFFSGLKGAAGLDSASLLTIYGSIGSAVQIVCPLLYGLLASPDGSLIPLAVFGAVFAAFGVLFMMRKWDEN